MPSVYYITLYLLYISAVSLFGVAGAIIDEQPDYYKNTNLGIPSYIQLGVGFWVSV